MFQKLSPQDFPITFCNNQIMNKMDRRKKRDQKKSAGTLSSLRVKRSTTELVSMDEHHLNNYLKIREQKVRQIEISKSGNIIRHDVISVSPAKPHRVVSSDSGMILDGVHGNKINRQNSAAMKSANKNKDRLVIELNDYLALTKTKNIAKFQLKPISDKSDRVNPVSRITDIVKTSSTIKFKEILKSEQLTKTKVGVSNEESQRTFLLVPQAGANSEKNELKLCQKQATGKQSKISKSNESSQLAKTVQKIGQNNHQISSSQFKNELKLCQKQATGRQSKISKSNELSQFAKNIQKIGQNNHQITSSQLSSILKSSKNISIKILDAKQQKPKLELPKETITPIIKVSKIIQRDKPQLNASSGKVFIQEKKKSNVVLRAHPYFSQHKPFIIKHKAGVTKVIENKDYSLAYQQEPLGVFLKSETNLHSVSEHNEQVDEIKYETPSEAVKFVMLDESEHIDQIFPVALKPTDSDDFEYLGLEANEEISVESEMQILGI